MLKVQQNKPEGLWLIMWQDNGAGRDCAPGTELIRLLAAKM
jgi:hypothetical protein